jgi:hypothetical protein
MKTDGLLPVSASSLSLGSNTYPDIYVPDELFIQYAGDAEGEPPTESQWPGCPQAALVKIKPMSAFTTDYPGQ